MIIGIGNDLINIERIKKLCLNMAIDLLIGFLLILKLKNQIID